MSIKYEKTDADPKPLMKYGFIIVGITVVFSVLMFICYYAFEKMYAHEKINPYVGSQDAREEIAFPVLQSTAKDDLKKIREEEKRVLSSYEWVDPQNKKVRIPIDEAMKLALEKKIFIQGENAS